MPAAIEPSTSTSPTTANSTSTTTNGGGQRYWLAAVFLAALAVRLWFAFDGHNAIVFSCDASEYLRDARGLSKIVSSPNLLESFRLLTEQLPIQEADRLRQIFAPAKELAIAGPIFPLFLWLSFACFSVPVTQANWFAPVLFQCIITASTCALIAYIGKAAWNRQVGIAAGAIAIAYPAFIVNSIRMYSESFSCFLLCAVVALAIPVVRKSGMFHSVTAGICLAFLQLTRSVMILVTGLMFLLSMWLSPGRSRFLRFTGLITGLAIVFAPWLLFQQLAFGKSSVVVDRVGHYNLFIGTNITTQGYLSYPYPDGRGIEKKSYATLIGAQLKESPERFARLMLDKPLRLLKYPWNDFRTRIGSVDINWQVIFHQVVLAFAAIGAALCLFTSASADKLRLRLLFLTLLAMHAVYLIFITVPRYNLTAIPFLILFAAAGAVTVVTAFDKRKSVPDNRPERLSRTAAATLIGALVVSMVFARIDWLGSLLLPLGASNLVALAVASAIKAFPLIAFFSILFIAANQLTITTRRFMARSAVLAMALAVIPLCSLPLRSHGRLFEWALSSDSSHAAKQFIAIPEEKCKIVSARDCYIIVDCMNWQALGNDGHLLVNGVELKGPLLPIMPFAQDLAQTKSRGGNARVQQRYLECEDIYASLTGAAGGGNLDLRQWFAVPVPKSIIETAVRQEEPGLNVEIDQKQATGSDLYGTYADAKDEHIRIPSVSRFSWEKAFYGVEAEDGFTDSRYDDRVSVRGGTAKLRSTGDTTTWRKVPNIRLLVAPPGAGEPGLCSSYKAEKTNTSVIELSRDQIAQLPKESTWVAAVNLRVESQARQPQNIPVNFAAVFESRDQQGTVHRYRSPWVPTSIVTANGFNSLRFAFPFCPDALPGELQRLSIECKAGGIAQSNDFFGVRGATQARVEIGSLDADQKIDSMTLQLLDLKSNPIGLGHEVL